MIALLSLSSSPLWVRMAGASIAVICFWRLAGAALCISLPSIFRRQSLMFSSASETRYSLLAGVFFAAHLWTYVHSAQTTSVAHVVLIFSAAPIFTAIGAALWFREKFPKHLYFVYLLAGLGVYLLMTDPIRASTVRAQATTVEGDVSALISAALHAVYVLASRQARREATNLRFSFWLYSISGFLFLMIALFQEQPLAPTHPLFYLAIGGLILFPSLLGHTLFTYLLKYVNVNILSCAKLLEPAFAVGMAYILFDEVVGAKTVSAFALMIAAVLILFRPWRALSGNKKAAA